MRLVHELAEWRALTHDARARGARVGLVPTMGALHAGHESLIARARSACDVVIVTVFVNPRQFGDAADLDNYPRTLDADVEVCARAGADAVVAPALVDMWPSYPAPTATTVTVSSLTARWEGVGRPGHFDGVTSVVAKLFALTGPCAAYFGEKDFQQLVVVRQMVADLAFDVSVVGCPIVRDADGLALSSRNARLSADGRARALALSRAVGAVADAPLSASQARATVARALADPGLDVAYADVVDVGTLEPVDDSFSGAARVLVAAVVDGVRLLDNGPVTIVGDA